MEELDHDFEHLQLSGTQGNFFIVNRAGGVSYNI